MERSRKNTGERGRWGLVFTGLRRRLAAAQDLLSSRRGQAAACLLLLLTAILRPHNIPQTVDFFAINSLTSTGEMLLHGLSAPEASYNMPLGSLAAAWSHYHLGGAAFYALTAALSAVGAWLTFSLGLLCGAPLAGLLAGFAFLLMPPGGFEQLLYTVYILLALAMLGLRYQRNTVLYSALAGLALGFTLLVRSPMFLFPALLFLYDIIRGEGARSERLLKAGLLLVACFLMLAPWARLNYSLHRSPVPLEYGRGDCNIVTGVKGSVFTMEGDCRALLPPEYRDRIAAWAVDSVLKSPLKYALAVARRVLAVLSMHPFLFLAGLAGFLLNRNKVTGAVFAVAAYFTLSHCLLSVEPRYILPLRAPLIFLAAAGASRLAGLQRPARKHGAAPLLLSFSLLALPAAGAELAVLAYPFTSSPVFSGLRGAMERDPDDAWLLGRKAALYLSCNSTAYGLAMLRSYAQRCDDPEMRSILDVLDGREKAAPPPGAAYEYLLVRALNRLEDGWEKGPALASARDHWYGKLNTLNGVRYRTGNELRKEIHALSDFTPASSAATLLYFWPPEKRRELLRLLGADRNAGKQPAGDAGIIGAGTADLRPLYRDAFEKRWLPLLGGKTYPALSAVARAYRISGDDRFRDNVIFALLPDREPSGMSPEVLYAAGFTGRQDAAGAAGFVGAKLDAIPELYLKSGELLLSSGETSPHLAGLLEYLERSPRLSFDQRHREALLCQAAGENERARRIIDGLLKTRRTAKLLNDRGVLHLIGGRRTDAAADFRAALALAPGLKDARLNLKAAGGTPEK